MASGNAGKLAEMRSLLAVLDIELVSQSEFDVPDAEETGIAFVDNALIKARHAAAHTGLPAIADDSGLAVDALDGAPGVHSARYAGTHGDDAANNAKLVAALEGLAPHERGAAFHCCLVATRTADDPVPVIAHGVWRGRVLDAPRGDHGFGYDPLFWVEADNASAAEMGAERKNAISHRARAMQQLVEQLRGHERGG
ncbi:50S ribosomal protein L33 [Salinisphaera sp. S4-8]